MAATAIIADSQSARPALSGTSLSRGDRYCPSKSYPERFEMEGPIGCRPPSTYMHAADSAQDGAVVAWPHRLPPPPMPLARFFIGFSNPSQGAMIGQLQSPPPATTFPARRTVSREPHQDIKSQLHKVASFALDTYSNSPHIPNADMEFSARDWEDIQRVAGLLGLTVDELVRRGGANPSGASSHFASNNQIPTHHPVAAQETVVPTPSHGVSQQEPAWQHVAVTNHDGSMEVDSFDASDCGDPPAAGPAGASSSSLPASRSGADVILLNPQATWYDCDAALWNFGEPASGRHNSIDGTSQPGEAEDASYDPVASMQVDSDIQSDGTAHEDDQERDNDCAGTEWAVISSSPASIPSAETQMAMTTSSADKRYHLIAPKTGRSASQSASQPSSRKARKRRSPYHGAKKMDTHLTRQLHACVRCRMQRNRVRISVLPNHQRRLSVTCVFLSRL